MKVSIIVPNFNHGDYLEQRLKSIFCQTYTNFEVIILDDCSTDNSRKIIDTFRDHPKISNIVYNDVNSGSSFSQWQKGIEIATGEYIWIAESDDFCERVFLEKLMPYLINDKSIALTYAQSYRIDENSDVGGTWLDHTNEFRLNIFTKDFIMDGNSFIEKYLIYKNVIPNASAVVFNRSRCLEIEGVDLDKDLAYCSDWHFYFKLLVNNKIAFYSQPLNYFRSHSSSVIGKAVKKHNYNDLMQTNLKARKLIMMSLMKIKPSNLFKIQLKNEYFKFCINLSMLFYKIRKTIGYNRILTI